MTATTPAATSPAAAPRHLAFARAFVDATTTQPLLDDLLRMARDRRRWARPAREAGREAA